MILGGGENAQEWERISHVMRSIDSNLFVTHAELQRVGDYRDEIPSLRNVDGIEFRTPVTYLIGENGSGKSTLIEAIAIAAGFNAEGGSKNFQFETVRNWDPDADPPAQLVRLSRTPRYPSDGYFLRAESFFNVATEIDRLGVTRGYGGQSLHAQSHGESFLSLLLNRFLGDGLYILDEPEAALSPSRQLSLLARMHDLVTRRGSQFIIATHSPIVMAYPGATIYQLDDDGLHAIAYEETEHYQVTRDFLNQRERMLRVLMEP
jgi:predicted ATPase